ncbi:hypothetical protein PN36_34820 [Candidatus Thiomargarita nelsonii]|uniref:Uncharacterized protein n=1 Tax=Candidatus Thiomargarita nelsonii TaxID=1003181 RepID=A0A4E0RKU3_9GAMM|nr:hypothetical protein PN36_34820 [Candidatus Thiomargarita nelsonii]
MPYRIGQPQGIAPPRVGCPIRYGIDPTLAVSKGFRTYVSGDVTVYDNSGHLENMSFVFLPISDILVDVRIHGVKLLIYVKHPPEIKMYYIIFKILMISSKPSLKKF